MKTTIKEGFDCLDLLRDRETRIVWLGVQMARQNVCVCLSLDASTARFTTSDGTPSRQFLGIFHVDVFNFRNPNPDHFREPLK